MGKFPRQLSGGEKQRVAIARAFARDLKILLFDEPFANLDAKFRATARLELRRLLNEFPVTTIYVTHDQQEAASMAERIVVMRSGRIEQAGSFDELFDNPLNVFIAQFVGVPTMNLFEGEVWDGHWQGENFGPYRVPVPVRDGTPILMGIRPHDIHLGDDVAGVIDNITPFYAERFHLLDVWLAGEEWQVQIPLETQVTKGETVHFKLDMSKAFFFNAISGNRIAVPANTR
jgi:multiple sugar transport system ATP-binding protein